MTNVITISNVEYIDFRKRKFEYVEGEYFDKFVEVGKGWIEFEVYEPFKIKDLYRKFANIDERNPKEILIFMNKYGNIARYDDNARPHIENVRYWQDEIIRMRKSILIFDIYSSENIHCKLEATKEEIEEIGNDALLDFLYSGRLSSSNKEDEIYNLRVFCLSELQDSLRDNISSLQMIPTIDINKDGTPHFQATMELPTLLSIMYWQLYIDLFENKRYFVCEGCNDTFEWTNNKKNYLCNGCSNHHKYKKQISIATTKAHRGFMNRSNHYTSKSRSSCLYLYDADKKTLAELREKIKDESLENQKIMDDEDYLKWLNKQSNIFMDKVKEYRGENNNG